MNNPIARQNGLVVQEIRDEVLVYDFKTNKAHCLNHSAGLVWKACDGTNSVADIARQFESAGGAKVTEDFVWLAIDQLKERDLLVTALPARFAGKSRRQVLRSIGLASVAALPIIASIITPANVFGALSACVCVVNSDCLIPAASNCPAMSCNPQGVCSP